MKQKEIILEIKNITDQIIKKYIPLKIILFIKTILKEGRVFYG